MEKDAASDPHWQYADGYGWYWDDSIDQGKKPKRQRKTATPKASAKKQPSKEPTQDLDEPEPKKVKKQRSQSRGKNDMEENKQAAKESKKPKEKNDTACKKRKKAEPQDSPEVSLPDPPSTKKAIRQEILDFLLQAEDYNRKTDGEAKEALKADLPLTEYVKAGFNLNIYWVRRGVKGVGCGVTSRAEGKDVGFFGYKTMCDDWVYATAAALKSCDLFAPFMHLKLFVDHCIYLKLILVVIQTHGLKRKSLLSTKSFLNYCQPL